jgi:predicted negative regulator of RcsB-dependent stress response
MHNIVLSRFVKAAVVLVAAVALLPVSALGQSTQAEKYQLRRMAGHGLYARDYPAEAFFILEELGDHALAAGDTAGAIQAYHDAAWIAGDEAKKRDAMFDPKTIGVGVDHRPRAAAEEAQRVLEKAIAIGGSDSPQMAPLELSRDLEDREVGMEIGRILYAITRPHLAILVFELVGDQALASGNNDLAERAYREGWFVAHEEFLRRNLIFDPKQVGVAQRTYEGFNQIADRLQEKADKAAG